VSGIFGKAKFETPPMVCRACGKQAKGPVQPGWIDMDLRDKETGQLDECVAFCRFDCMTTWIGRQNTMIDPTKPELDALLLAGEAGGQYLESLGRYDLSALSQEEWTTFLSCVISKYQDEKIPF
jgi:hypothetical protein